MKRRIVLLGLMARLSSWFSHPAAARLENLLAQPRRRGIPPDIRLKGDNLAAFTVDVPLPAGIVDERGESSCRVQASGRLGHLCAAEEKFHFWCKHQGRPVCA